MWFVWLLRLLLAAEITEVLSASPRAYLAT